MSQINQEAQKLNPSALIPLFTLDATKVGGTVLRFTTMIGANLATNVVFGGLSYQPMPIEFSGFEISGAGALPRPTMKLANTDGLIQAVINTWGDLNGCTLTRVRTFARFLDGQPEADSSAYYGPDLFQVDRKTSDTPTVVTWELSAHIDQQGRKIGRPVIRDTCLFRYRVWNGTAFDYTNAICPYTGSAYFTELDVSTANPALDVPSRKLSCCEKRFGVGNPLPFGGFPGVSRSLS